MKWWSFTYKFYPESTAWDKPINMQPKSNKNRVDINWQPVTTDDTKAYLGLRVYMSMLCLPNLNMYWSQDAVFGSGILPQKGWHEIDLTKSCRISMQLMPPLIHQDHDKLAHIRAILEAEGQEYLQNYNPHQNVSIDEAMVAFRGRLGWRQYMPIV